MLEKLEEYKECSVCHTNISHLRGYRKYCAECRWKVQKQKAHEYREKAKPISKQDKYWILQEYNNRCVDCGIQGGLEFHHIRYGKNPLLIPLCKQCHVKRHHS